MTPSSVLAQLDPDFFKGPREDSCVADNGFCPEWIVENFGTYVGPFLEHVALTVIPLTFGFLIAGGLGLLAHRRQWLVGPTTGVTNVLYTIPSIALFLLLLPYTGRGNVPAIIGLTLYSLNIMFVSFVSGLRNVPHDIVDAASGQGLTGRQILWRVEVPLAVPEILAGLRIAASTLVGLAALAVFAGAGGLGPEILTDIYFKSNVVVAGGLMVLLAGALELIVLGVQRAITPWRRAAV